MPIFTFANNVSTTLSGAVSSSATTITLASTANLPTTIPSGEVLAITLNDAATRQNFEVVYATARTGATLTVERAQEGTAALSWLVGDFAYSPPTAGQQASFGQLGAENTWAEANTFTDSSTGGVIVNGTSNTNGANVELEGNGATTPNKYVRAQDGSFQILNNGYSSAILTLTDAGALTVTGTATIAPGTSSGNGVNLGQFPSSLTNPGWKKYPDPNSPTGYFIEQWGTGTITSTGTGNTSVLFNLPVAYPNAQLFCMAGYNGTAPGGVLGAISASEYSTSQIEVSIYTSAAESGAAVKYWSKGY